MPRFITVGGTIFNVKEITHVMRRQESVNGQNKLMVQVFIRENTWVKLWADDEADQARIFNQIRDMIDPRPPISPVVATLAANVFETLRGEA